MKTNINLDHSKMMHEAASAGNWDVAIQHALRVPGNHGPFAQLPQYNIPPEHIDKVLNSVPKKQKPEFLFELSGNLHPDLSHEQLSNIGEEHGGKDDFYVSKNIMSHPNWNPKDDRASLSKKAASEFWRSYERSVQPHHFAVIKSMQTGKPEEVTDHRGRIGKSHEGYVSDGFLYEDKSPRVEAKGPHYYGNTFVTPLSSIHPHLKEHARMVQKAIMEDPDIEKKVIRGKVHIKLHRGVGGPYAEKISEASGFEPENRSVKNVKLKIDKAPFSSWSTDPKFTSDFANFRAEDLSGKNKSTSRNSIVFNHWLPLENVLHSGYHKVHTDQEHAHPNENEIVVSHPKGFETIHSKDIHFLDESTPFNNESRHKPGKVIKDTKKITKSIESEVEFLAKSPLTTEGDWIGESSVSRPPSFLKHQSTKKLANGLYHHHFSDPLSDDHSHIISQHKDPKKPGMAEVAGHVDGGAFHVGTSKVDPQYKGQGIGKAAYLAALHHHGKMYSDKATSPKANKAWQSLEKLSGGAVFVKMGKEDHEDSPHFARIHPGKKSDLTTMLYGGKIEGPIKPKEGVEPINKSDLTDAAKKAGLALGLTLASHHVLKDPSKQNIENQVRHQASIPSGISQTVHPAVDQSKKEQDTVGDFLHSIAQVESSGGVNLNHKKMQSGIHAGSAAVGLYGLMPHTIREMADRANKMDMLPPDMQAYRGLSNEDIANHISKNPHHEDYIARFMAGHLLNRFHGDPFKAAYSWNQGHNTPSYRFDLVDYKNHPYVKKFRDAWRDSLSKKGKDEK